MRVIAGRSGGIRLRAPRGTATRPITDRAKETLFAILATRLPGARVLDLYAGSGALGIEALSRGAVRATFVERDRQALTAIDENLRATGLSGSARVVPGDVLRFLATDPGERFDLSFLDPPYAERAILAPLERLVPWLAAEAIVVVKHFWRSDPPAPASLSAYRTRRFGETTLTFLAHRPAAEA